MVLKLDPPTPLQLRLTHLLGLHGSRVLPAEAELGDGHVVQDDVEVFSSLKQFSADQQRDLRAQSQSGGVVKLRNHECLRFTSSERRPQNLWINGPIS